METSFYPYLWQFHRYAKSPLFPLFSDHREMLEKNIYLFEFPIITTELYISYHLLIHQDIHYREPTRNQADIKQHTHQKLNYIPYSNNYTQNKAGRFRSFPIQYPASNLASLYGSLLSENCLIFSPHQTSIQIVFNHTPTNRKLTKPNFSTCQPD